MFCLQQPQTVMSLKIVNLEDWFVNLYENVAEQPGKRSASGGIKTLAIPDIYQCQLIPLSNKALHILLPFLVYKTSWQVIMSSQTNQTSHRVVSNRSHRRRFRRSKIIIRYWYQILEANPCIWHKAAHIWDSVSLYLEVNYRKMQEDPMAS